MMGIQSRQLAFAILFVLLIVCLAMAQATTGTISGTVKDPSGAVIPNAAVTLRNDAVGLKRTTATDNEGAYTFPVLPVGDYILSADAPGFSRFESTPVRVDLNKQVRVDIELRIGSREQTVTVSAQARLVDTTSSTLGEIVGERQIVDLPLVGRNFLELAVLQAGVTPAKTVEYEPSAGSKLLNQFSSEQVHVNGLRIQSNNYLLDGGDNNEPFYGFVATKPDPDAVQEFRILTNSYTAEFGRGGGGIINVITKSGTNEIHGTIFEFLRNDVLDARNFFADEVAPLKQNQFGGSVGGPILKDKIFFFFNYEGLRKRDGLTVNTVVPSPLERQGNFSQSANPPIDPLTGLPFLGDVIPSSRIDPVAQNLLGLYPPPVDGQNRFVSAVSAPTDGDQFTIKIDQNAGSKDKFTYNYHFNDFSLTDPNPQTFFGRIGIPGFGTKDSAKFQRFILMEDHLFTSNVINTFRLSYNRVSLSTGLVLNKRNRFDFGFTYPSRNLDDLPIIAIAGFSPFGLITAADFSRISNTFQWTDDISVVKGRHNLRFGTDVRRIRLKSNALAFETGGFFFAGFASGNPFGDFLLGQPLFFLQLSGDLLRYWHSTQAFFYAQDDIRVTPNFTLNVGVRYEIFGPMSELRDRVLAFRPGQQSTVIPGVPEGMVVVGDPGISRSTIDTDLNNFAPRIGFAWDLLGNRKISIRGAYGVFYDNVVGFTPFQLTLFPTANLSQFLFGPPSFSDPFLGSSPFAGIGPLPANVPQQINPLDPDFTTPYAQQWNLTLQHEFAPNFLFQIAYVGTKGTHLVGTHELNPADFVPGNSTPANVQQRRRFPQFAGIFNNETNSRSTYHSLQLTVKHQFSHGFSFDAAYTWSKTIDGVSVLHPFNSARGQQAFAQNPDDLDAEKGRAAFDIRQRLVVNGIWDLPFLRQTDLKGKVFGNWTVSGILSAQTGVPITVLDSANPSVNGSGAVSDRPDLVPGCNVDRPGGVDEVAEFFNTACFVPVPFASGRFGTAGRNIITGPSLVNLDIGIFKGIPIDEIRQVQFRFEVFNVFNHPNFALPDNDIRSPTFGQLLNTIPGNERRMQFGIKFFF